MIPTIADMRRAADLTQTAAAEALGVSQAALAVWETGKAWPTLDKLKPLAELYGVTLGALVTALVAGKEAAHE